MAKHILILDDPSSDLSLLSQAFVDAAGSEDRIKVVQHRDELFAELKDLDHFGLVVLEDVLDGNRAGGMETLVRLHREYPRLPIVVVIDEKNLANGVEMIRAGATDYLVRGQNIEALVSMQLRKINQLAQLLEINRKYHQQFQYLREVDRTRFKIIGKSPQIQEIIARVRRVAAIPRPVLITGPRGSGKELVARAIHDLAGSAGRPLVTVNCAAFSESMLESELFGHEKGAFTGAVQRFMGRFEQADGGTLFLDEIGNMSLSFQQKIMRAVEYGTFSRVGGRQEIKVNTRIVAATNANLPELIDQGKFLADLYDRLSFEVIQVPPLRDRPGDIEVLAQYFLNKFMEEIPSFRGKRLSAETIQVLRSHRFSGNVRELKNIIERAVYRDTTNEITPEDLGMLPSGTHVIGEGSFEEKIQALESVLLRDALKDQGGNQAAAARTLGLSYHQFRYYLKKHQLSA